MSAFYLITVSQCCIWSCQNPQAFTVADVVADKVKPDIKAEAEEMLNKLDAGSAKVEQKDLPKVDDNCEIKKTR